MENAFVYSAPLQALYLRGKQWISALWGEENHNITFTLERKEIGRNKGFIIVASVQNKATQAVKTVRYYAKMQILHVETLLMHHMLQAMSCGPVRYFITILPCEHSHPWEANPHGVITEEVSQLVLAAHLQSHHQIHPDFPDSYLQSELCMLVIIVQLGKFSSIPHNQFNWGFTAKNANVLKWTSRLSIIDFSSTDTGNQNFASRDIFEAAIQRLIAYIRHTLGVSSAFAIPDSKSMTE